MEEREKRSVSPLCCRSPTNGATAYQILHRSTNRQDANNVARKDPYLALSPQHWSMLPLNCHYKLSLHKIRNKVSLFLSKDQLRTVFSKIDPQEIKLTY
ncbi:UNVERIFIED_CONTAM: hypothetical protein NCL1_11378 [Trichonephila clavipes]